MTTLQLEQEALKTVLLTLDLIIPAAPIESREERIAVNDKIKNAKELRADIEAKHQPTAKKIRAHKVYQDALENEHIAYDDIDAFVKAQTGRIKQFDTAEALKAQREAERLVAERRDREEKERAKLEAKAEKELDKGNTAKAEILLEQAQNVRVQPSFSPAPAASKKLTTKATVTNLFKLCKLIAEGVVPFSVVEVKISALNAWAKDQDPKAEFDGIYLYQETTRI